MARTGKRNPRGTARNPRTGKRSRGGASGGGGGGGSTLVAALLATNPTWCYKLNEPSGTNADDSTPNNNDGTYTSVTLGGKTGPGGTYADFGGTNSRVAPPPATMHIPAGGMSGFAIVNPDTLTSFRDIMSVLGPSNYEWDFNNNSGTIEMAIVQGGSTNILKKVVAAGRMITGSWQGVLFTITGNTNAATITIYHNGGDAGGTVTVGTGTMTPTGTGYVGHRADGIGTQAWGTDGGIAYASLWNGVVLTAAQIASIFAAAASEGWFGVGQLHYDNFDRGNAIIETGAPITWVRGGTDQIQTNTNQVRMQSANTSGGDATVNAGTPNQWCEIDINTAPNTAWTLLLGRYTDNSNLYRFGFEGTQGGTPSWRLYKRKAGTWTMLAELNATAPTPPFRIRLEIDGTSVRGYQVVAGVKTLKVTGVLDAALTGTRYGILQQCFATGDGFADNFAGGQLTALHDFIMALGPAAYWKVNEASGSIIDLSGNGRHMTPVGMAFRTFVAPDGDAYGQFDASRSEGTYGPGLSWQTTGLSVFTLRRRYKVETGSTILGTQNGDWQMLTSNWGTSGDRLTFSAGASTPNSVIYDGVNVTPMVMVGMTITAAGAVNAYWNGVNVGSASANTPTPVTSAVIYGFGRGPTGAQNTNQHAHTFIYKGVLTPAQITALQAAAVAQGLIGV